MVAENGGIDGGITMIYRPLYVDTPFAKNFTGVHRCGKSTIHKMSVAWSFAAEDTL